MRNKNGLLILLAALVLLVAGIWLTLRSAAETKKRTTQATAANESQAANGQATITPFMTPKPEVTDTEIAKSAAALPACGYTPESTAGPYYISGTMQLQNGNLNYGGLSGTPVRIGGYVYGSDGNNTPLVNAKIELWHADGSGSYHPQKQGSVDGFAESAIKLRGFVVTDTTGYYEFSSILPAEYEGRTRHIHTKVVAEGYQERISQIIVFKDGDRTEPADDPVARIFPTCSIADFTENDGVQTAAFNFHIQKL